MGECFQYVCSLCNGALSLTGRVDFLGINMYGGVTVNASVVQEESDRRGAKLAGNHPDGFGDAVSCTGLGLVQDNRSQIN